MELREYLSETGQSYGEFAAKASTYSRRTRPISRQTIQGIAHGAGCHTDTAEAIIAATDGKVMLPNLVTRRLSRKHRKAAS